MAESIKGLYRPRNPTTMDFYRLVEDHSENLELLYPEKYEKLFGFYRPVVTTTMHRYLECGIFENGFARVRCGDCKEEFLVPFSCKTRGGFCNSCSEKRSLIFGERIANEILEDVNHKHYVFSIPKIIRPYFKYDRKLLGKLCRCGYDTVTAFYREVVPDETAVPGAVLITRPSGRTLLITTATFTVFSRRAPLIKRAGFMRSRACPRRKWKNISVWRSWEC